MSRINSEILSITPSSGSGTANTNRLTGILRQVLVKPTTATTTYDIKITNPNSIDIYERTSNTGTLADEVVFPILGINTVELSNASVDEVFTVVLMQED